MRLTMILNYCCSVLVHIGGAHDGRYCAFIRPTLSDQWYGTPGIQALCSFTLLLTFLFVVLVQMSQFCCESCDLYFSHCFSHRFWHHNSVYLTA